MGIPSFFRWIERKYPKCVKFNKENDIDNLYLDFNGAIHTAYNEYVKNIQNNIDDTEFEQDLIKFILQYLTKLIDIINPQKLLFISIDGVPPMAKIHQQRIRRYRSAIEKKVVKKVYQKHNKEYINVWNRSSITPGTNFMNELSNQLIKFIKSNIKNISIILSNSNVSGEGEHKIIHHIKKYSDNNSCCIYGLDADLILLAMSTHKPNISIFREEMKMSKNGFSTTGKFIHINVPYIANKLYNQIISKCSQEFTQKQIINDIIFVSFLLGNDFVPNLPSIKIKSNGIENLLECYTQSIIKTKNTLLLCSNKLNIYTFKEMLQELALNEEKHIRAFRNYSINVNDDFDTEFDKDLYTANIIKHTDLFQMRKKGWKSRYYRVAFGLSNQDIYEYNNQRKQLTLNYITGLLWNLKYYNSKCPSWSWHYKSDYAPFASDILNSFKSLGWECIKYIHFKPDKPTTQLKQLMMVLPRSSFHLLPDIIRTELLLDKEMMKYYPETYQLETHNRHFIWECKPIIPQINLEIIDTFYNKIRYKLTDIEKEYNIVGRNFNVY
jgi:5'-3' exonuclease